MKSAAWITLLGAIGMVAAAYFGNARPLEAQDGAAPTGRIGWVDVVRIFNGYQRQIDLQVQLEEADNQLRAQGERRRLEIEQLQTQLSAMQIDDPAYGPRRNRLDQLQFEIRTWSELARSQMGRELGAWTGRIYEEIMQATAEVAQQQRFDLVLYKDEFVPAFDNPEAIREQIRTRKVIYGSERVDLSQAVLERLNAAYSREPSRQMFRIGLIEDAQTTP